MVGLQIGLGVVFAVVLVVASWAMVEDIYVGR